MLESSIVMQLKDTPAVTLKPGQVSCEGTSDVHTVGKNVCNAKPAKVLVALVKNRGVEAVLPAN